jgi:transcriptional regulator with XRE-family HTH domain
MEIMQIIGKRIKSEREALKRNDSKWTQEFVADLIGVARPTYTAYENGTKLPPVDTLNNIADTFDCDTDYLSGRSNIRKKTEMNLSFYGGPQGWTEDELEEAESAVRRYREMKERAAREAEKNK